VLQANANRLFPSGVASVPTSPLMAAINSLYCSSLYLCQSASRSFFGSAQESDEAEAGVSFAVAEISVHCAVCEITS